VENIMFQFPLGMSIAASIRVAQFLGDANRDGAITTARVGVIVNSEFL
jgi:Na+-driven multidrug efflux pump